MRIADEVNRVGALRERSARQRERDREVAEQARALSVTIPRTVSVMCRPDGVSIRRREPTW